MRKVERDVIKEIKSGKYRDCYLIYCRKSCDEADSQVNSIEFQKREVDRFNKRQKKPIADLTLPNFCLDGVITERHSAYKENDQITFSRDGKVQYKVERPKFLQAVQFLSAGHFKGLICLVSNRISRNKADNAIIGKLKRQGVDFQFVQGSYDNSSAGELHYGVDEMFANYHSINTSNTVKKATEESRRDGYVTGRAAIGYLNTGKMENKPFDPERAQFITEFFELYNTGEWSQSALARYANEQGMTTVPMRRRRTREELLADEEVKLTKVTRPITKTHISKILRNPFYTGRTLNHEGIWIKSKSHERLIDDATFDSVQTRLREHTLNLHCSKSVDLPMRGLVRCAYCHRLYTPYRKKGILYFYSQCLKGCENTKRNYNFDLISEIIKNMIQKLHFTDNEIEAFEAQTGSEIARLEQKRSQEIERTERQKKRIRDDLAYLRSERLQLLRTGVFTPEDFSQEVLRLEREQDGLLDFERTSEASMREVMKDVRTLSELLKLTVPLYENVEMDIKEKIARNIFSELFVAENKLDYKVKRGFEVFLDRNVSVGAQSTSISELYEQRDQIKANIAALQKIVS